MSLSTSAETYLCVLRRIIFSKIEGTGFKNMLHFSDLELLHARTRLFLWVFVRGYVLQSKIVLPELHVATVTQSSRK